MLKYPSMDAADASLVTLAERAPRAKLVTTDRRDFQFCRGLRNRALKLVLPD
jgi:predicted nucleic acid-binding protein